MSKLFILYFILQVYCEKLFNSPYAITLPNKNIFVIHELAIDIYDPSLRYLIKRIWEFSYSERIQINYYNQFAKINLKFEFGYILCILNDKIHIFSDNGTFIYRGQNTIISGETPNFSYTLVCLELKDDIYYYIVGFLDRRPSPNLYLALYGYDIKRNRTTLKNEYNKFFENYHIKGSTKSFYQSFLSCEYMYNSILDKNFLVCFTIDELKYILAIHYEIYIESNNKYIIEYYENNDIFFNNKKIKENDINDLKGLRSGVNTDHTLALVCYQRDYSHNGTCSKYNITSMSFYNYTQFEKRCGLNFYGLNVGYIYEKEKIVFSCIDITNNGSLQVQFYDKQNLEEDNKIIYKFLPCNYIAAHSILYIKDIQKYFVLSDVRCNNKDYPFQELMNSTLQTMEEVYYYFDSEKNKN